MKHFHYPIITLLLLCLWNQPIHAQSRDYSSDYIITLEGDTLFGEVKDRKEGSFPELYSRIRFWEAGKRSKKKFSPNDILAYANENQLYESLPLKDETAFFVFRYYFDEGAESVFLKVAARNQYLTYYQWEYMDSESSYIDYIPLFYKNGASDMVRVTQGMLGLKRKQLSEYFADCPTLVYALEKKWLTEIMQVYDFYWERCKDQ